MHDHARAGRPVIVQRPRRLITHLATLATATGALRPGLPLPGQQQPYAAGPPVGSAGPWRRALLRRSLRACTREGIVAEMVGACSGSAVSSAWALHLNASPFEFGLLGALPFLSQALQPVAAVFTARWGPRRVALWAVTLQRQLVLALVALVWLPLPPQLAMLVLFAVSGLQAAFGVVGNNAWVSWMSELVPEALRGRYFGQRTALCTVGGTLCGLVVGVALDAGSSAEAKPLVLSGLALAAAVTGAITTYLMAQQHDVSPSVKAERFAHSWSMPWRDPRGRALLLYKVVWNAAVGVGGGFFALHVLDNLAAGFVLLSLHGAGVAVVRVAMAPVWGRVLDDLGAPRVLALCSAGVALMPLSWLLPQPHMLWPLAVDAVLAGLFWSGHGLADLALPMSFGTRQSRPYYLAAFSMAGGLAYASAATVGGAIATALPERVEIAGQSVYGLYALFVLSAWGRGLGAWLAMRCGRVAPAAKLVYCPHP